MKRSFTLIETIITVVIILIFATFGLVGYRQILDNARQRVDETNQQALARALAIYSLENDRFPATLGELKLEHLKKAYAEVIEKGDWFTKFSYFFVKLNTPPQVYAQFLTPENLAKYGVREEMFHCPADPNGLPSYGLNEALANKRWDDIAEGEILIGDCDAHTFDITTLDTDLAYRHITNWGTKRITVVTTKGGKVIKDDDEEMDVQGDCEAVCESDYESCKITCSHGPGYGKCKKNCKEDKEDCIEDCHD
jgi:competence protein ComGC